MRCFITTLLLLTAVTAVLALDLQSPQPLERNGDSCDDAILITYWPISIDGTTTDNSDTYGYQAPDEWYSVTLPGSGPVYFGLCDSAFDTYIYLLSGDCSTELASNDDSCGLQSELNINLDPGTYKVCVDGWSSSSGSYTLDVDSDIPCQGNDCDDPFEIEEFPFSAEWQTDGYSNTGFESSPDVYYRFMVWEDGLYTFTTCQSQLHDDYFDTHLLLLAEDCSSVVADNYDDCDGAYDDWSTLTCCLSQGLYFLVVEGEGNASGNFQLDAFREGDCTPCDPPFCPGWGIVEQEPNDGSDDDPFSYNDIAGGEIICGTVWSSGSTRDSDWYLLALSETTPLNFLLDGEEGENLELTLLDYNDGDPLLLAAATEMNECADFEIEGFSAEPGTYVLRIAYDDYYDDEPTSDYTLSWHGVHAAAEEGGAPDGFTLAQNYPNPFNPVTTIEFSLTSSQELELCVYSTIGQETSVLANGVYAAGTHQVSFDGSAVPGGVYFYTLRTENEVVTRKMLLVK